MARGATKAKAGKPASRHGGSASGRGKSAQAARKLHLHVENITSYHEHVQIKPAQYAQVARRYPDVAPRVRATFGADFGKKFDSVMKTAEVLVLIGLDLPRERFAERAPNVRWIQLTAAGVEHIMPFDWLPEHVTLTNNSGVQAEKLGEFALTALLMLNRGVPMIVTNQRRAKWVETFRTPIAGKTLAVIGVGKVGGAAARQAKKVGMRVLGVRSSARSHRYVDEMYGPGDLDRVLPAADFVLVTLPLTAKTKNMIGRKQLALMKPGAGVVNLGRAGTMDYAALAKNLERGSLGGAVLDVFDPEPLPSSSPLWKTPNLIISPHTQSSDETYSLLTLDIVFRNLQRYLANRRLLNRVNRLEGY